MTGDVTWSWNGLWLILGVRCGAPYAAIYAAEGATLDCCRRFSHLNTAPPRIMRNSRPPTTPPAIAPLLGPLLASPSELTTGVCVNRICAPDPLTLAIGAFLSVPTVASIDVVAVVITFTLVTVGLEEIGVLASPELVVVSSSVWVPGVDGTVMAAVTTCVKVTMGGTAGEPTTVVADATGDCVFGTAFAYTLARTISNCD